MSDDATHLRGLNTDRVLRIAVDREDAFTSAELIQPRQRLKNTSPSGTVQ